MWERRRPVALLHYERLGADYLCERNALLAARLRPGDIAADYGAHCRMPRANVEAQQRVFSRMALPVPLLSGATKPARPRGIEAEKTRLRESGLFQDEWYLAQYPDVADAGLDPLDHFCRNGWRERRRPNPLFDPVWYVSAYGELIGDMNPLLDYVLAGEQLGRKPAADFDPIEHRFRHNLPTAESPLRHRLESEAASSG
jgi:hypothetical protein